MCECVAVSSCVRALVVYCIVSHTKTICPNMFFTCACPMSIKTNVEAIENQSNKVFL